MPGLILIDYGCHSFTYRLATQLADGGLPIRYFANGSLESPNLSSLGGWQRSHPSVVRTIACKQPYGKLSLLGRLRGELEWAGRCIRALQEENPTAVVVSCLPLAVVTRIHNWCRRRRIPVVYWLQDMQGRAIHDLLGRKFGLPGKALGALAQLWEQQMLEESRIVITIAPGHENELPKALRDERRYALLENWANVEEFPPLPAANDWSKRHGLDGTRNVLYAGTLGLKHDLDTFLSLAAHLLGKPDVRVVVVSSGQAALKLKEEAAARGLSNLVVLPFQPQSEVAKVLSSAAVLVAPLDASAGKFCVPSKILSYLCAGRPIVLAIDANNRAAEMVLRAGAGAVVPSGDTLGFVDAVTRLIDDEAARGQAGRRARAFAEETFASERITQSFLAILTRARILAEGAQPASIAAPMQAGRLGIPICNIYARVLWLALAAVTVVSEIIPTPHLKPLFFYGLYSPAKLICFLALGFLTPLAFARLNNLNRGIGFAALSAAIIEVLQGLIGNGHSFHWYELLAKLSFILIGFMIGLDARFERVLSVGALKIPLLSDGAESKPAA